jgi:hypothetical protein
MCSKVESYVIEHVFHGSHGEQTPRWLRDALGMVSKLCYMESDERAGPLREACWLPDVSVT